MMALELPGGERLWVNDKRPILGGTGAFSADGRIVFGSINWDDPVLHLFDSATGERIRTMTGHHTTGTLDLFAISAIVSVDDRACTAGGDGTVRLWNLKKGEEIAPVVGPVGPITRLVFTPDDRKLIAGGQHDSVRVWDLATGREETPAWLQKSVTTLAVSADGKHVVRKHPDLSVDLVNRETGQGRIIVPPGQTDDVNAAGFSPDGRLVATGWQNFGSRLWDVATGQELEPLKVIPHRSLALGFSADGQFLYSLGITDNGEQCHPCVWDVAARKSLGVGPAMPLDGIGAVLSPTTASDWSFCTPHAEQLRFWTVNEKKLQEKAPHRCAGLSRVVAVAPDGERLVAALDGGLWLGTRTGNQSSMWNLPGPVHGLAFSHDGTRLAVGNGDGTIFLLRLGN